MILGVDFSLTGTGVCAIADGEAECETFGSRAVDWWAFGERPREIAAAIDKWHGADRPAWVIESPSFMSRGRAHDNVLVGWHMLIDTMVFELGYNPPLLVAPSQLKKFVTGRGNAAKDEVLLATARRFPDVVIENNNEADALVLAAIGTVAYKEPFQRLVTKHQQDIVDRVVGGTEKP